MIPCHVLNPLQHEHRRCGQQILHHEDVDPAAAVQVGFTGDDDPVRPAKMGEIGDGKGLPARLLVPGLGQIDRAGDAPGKQELQPAAPVAPVGKADHRPFPHPQHLLQDHRRVIQVGQRLAEHHIVEAVIGIIPQPFLQVALAHAEAAAHARQHPGLTQLDTATLDAFLMHQVIQQRAVAAAQVEHRLALRDEIGDDLKVGTKIVHMPSSRASRSIKLPSKRVIVSTSTRKASCPASLSMSR